jgi:phosphopantetheinyl transferase (holo-ACP synthase)
MPEINLFVQSTSPHVIIAKVSAGADEVKTWTKIQNRFPSRDVTTLSSHRQLEHLAVDQTMNAFGRPWANAQIDHDEHGKPQLMENEKFISISHHSMETSCWAVICLGDQSVGCDIERPRTQLHSIAKRFLSAEEQNSFNTTPMLCCAWGVKESMFKTIGHDIDFRVDLTVNAIHVASADSLEAIGTLKGRSSNWKIWKVTSSDKQDKGGIELFAVAGPSDVV